MAGEAGMWLGVSDRQTELLDGRKKDEQAGRQAGRPAIVLRHRETKLMTSQNYTQEKIT